MPEDLRLRPLSAADKPLAANLVQLYLYDLAAEMAFPIGRDGRYEYDFLERFWQHPYLIEAGGEIAGFAFVIDACPLTARTGCWFMAEFFVMRPMRRTGLGRSAVEAVLARHPGDWHIAALEANAPALAFWRACLAVRAPRETALEFDGDRWRLSAFSA